MAPSAVLVVPGRLDTRTGGYIYDRRVVEGLRRLGWDIDVRELDDSFPRPSAAALTGTAEVLTAIRDGTLVLIDSLALGAIPDLIERHATRLRLVALVHLPLAADVALPAAQLSAVARAEERAMKAVRLVIVTGNATVPLLARYAIPSSRIVIVEPGCDRVAAARGSTTPTVHLICVATVGAGKGHLDLLEALSALRSARWRLSCAGSLTRDPRTSEAVTDAVVRLGLEQRVSCVGDLDPDDLASLYDQADVFVLATRRETYGMAVAEALARGLPIVSTTTGAIPEMVDEEAGVLVPPGDVTALQRALSRVIDDGVFRSRLAAGARRAAERLPTWDESVRRVAAALEAVGRG